MSLLFITVPFLKKDQMAWFACLTLIFLSGISQVTVLVLVPHVQWSFVQGPTEISDPICIQFLGRKTG